MQGPLFWVLRVAKNINILKDYRDKSLWFFEIQNHLEVTVSYIEFKNHKIIHRQIGYCNSLRTSISFTNTNLQSNSRTKCYHTTTIKGQSNQCVVSQDVQVQSRNHHKIIWYPQLQLPNAYSTATTQETNNTKDKGISVYHTHIFENSIFIVQFHGKIERELR